MPPNKKRDCHAVCKEVPAKKSCIFAPGCCWRHFHCQLEEPVSCPQKDSLWGAVVKSEVETLLSQREAEKLIAYWENAGMPWNIHGSLGRSLGRIKPYCAVAKDLVQELEEPASCPQKDPLRSAVFKLEVQTLWNEWEAEIASGETSPVFDYSTPYLYGPSQNGWPYYGPSQNGSPAQQLDIILNCVCCYCGDISGEGQRVMNVSIINPETSTNKHSLACETAWDRLLDRRGLSLLYKKYVLEHTPEPLSYYDKTFKEVILYHWLFCDEECKKAK